MQFIQHPPPSQWSMLLKRPRLEKQSLETQVAAILAGVKSGGDDALRKYSLHFDNVAPENFRVTQAEFHTAEQQCSPELIKAIETAKRNIGKFHSAQKDRIKKIETMPGVVCWRNSVAIESIGLYIPGGTAPLFSTILMLGIPARLAGCHHIYICTPPRSDETIHPAILHTARLVGIKKVYKVGGVQAIGAMAYGTQTIPKADKLFGPGNQYVTAAKQLVAKEGIAIDLPAGPSELAVIADKSCNPAFVAADLLSQAEHGADSQVMLISDNDEVLNNIMHQIKIQLPKLPRNRIIAAALNNSKAILLKNMEQAIDLVNQYAPEHLILAVHNDEALAKKVVNAGSVFLGNYSPESVGDYASGTNHTLPTGGFARAYSGVSLDSFVKKITFQKLSREGLSNIAATVEIMAEHEELLAHKNAVSIRKNS